MKKSVLCWLAGLAVSGLSAATVNYTGATDGDLATDTNWSGGAKPGVDDSALIDATGTVPADGWTLSSEMWISDFTVSGLSDFLLNLGGHALGVTNAFSVTGGSATFQNGTISNITSFAVGEDSSVTFTNGVFLNQPQNKAFVLNKNNSSLVIDGSTNVVAVNDKYVFFANDPTLAGCLLDVRNGGLLQTAGYSEYSHISGTGNTFLIRDGGTVLVNGGSSSSAHVGRGFKFYKATDCTLAITNGTLGLFVLTFGNAQPNETQYSSGAYNGLAVRNRAIFHNATISVYNTNRGLNFGSTVNPNQSYSNRVDVTGTSGTLTLSRVSMRGAWDVFRMEGSTVKMDGWGSGGLFLEGQSNRFENAGGTLTLGNNGVHLTGTGNVYEICGGTGPDKSVSVRGMDNVYRLSSGIQNAATITTGNMSNRVEITGGVSLAKLVMDGTNNAAWVTGGTVTGTVSFAGRDNCVTVTGGEVNLASWCDGLRFENGSSNSVFCVSNTTVVKSGSFSRNWSSEGILYPFTNCPNCALEFRGAQPLFKVTSAKVSSTADPYPGVALGLDGAEMEHPLRLRYVVPDAGYETAPFQNVAGSNHNVELYDNAVFEVVLASGERPQTTLMVPLLYDQGGFWNRKHSKSSIDIEGLNAHAILPFPELGTRLIRENNTVFVRIPSGRGTMVLFR